MPVLIVMCVSLGLDSLRVAATIGLGAALRHRVELAVAFGVCDGVASLVGLVAGHAVATVSSGIHIVSAAAIGVCAVWLLFHGDGPPSGGRALLLVPVALSLDNLVAGVAMGSVGVPAVTALVLGATSAAMAAVGVSIGTVVRQRLHRDTSRVSGFLLLVMAGAHGLGLR
jgi:putative Mn2+ efflux pump MntP